MLKGRLRKDLVFKRNLKVHLKIEENTFSIFPNLSLFGKDKIGFGKVKVGFG